MPGYTITPRYEQDGSGTIELSPIPDERTRGLFAGKGIMGIDNTREYWSPHGQQETLTYIFDRTRPTTIRESTHVMITALKEAGVEVALVETF